MSKIAIPFHLDKSNREFYQMLVEYYNTHPAEEKWLYIGRKIKLRCRYANKSDVYPALVYFTKHVSCFPPLFADITYSKWQHYVPHSQR